MSVVSAVVELADTDSSGSISKEEFVELMRVLGAEGGGLFERVDADGNGKLSTGELVRSLHAFYTDEQPQAAANWLLGDLETAYAARSK